MKLHEGEDFYIERGFVVLTAAFLARRGYCCASGCRHCPYWPRHSGSRTLRPTDEGSDGPPRERERS